MSKSKFAAAVLIVCMSVCMSISSRCAYAQESARFTIRGFVNEVSNNDFTGLTQATVFTNDDTYIVTCPSSGFPTCSSLLNSSEGQCANLNGYTVADYINPPYTVEFLYLDLIGFPANCTTTRNRFIFTGHVVNYVPAVSSPTGYPEFEVSAVGYTFRVVCDPPYTGCNLAAQNAITSGKCVAVSGDIDMFVLGVFGDMTVINWGTFIQTFNRLTC